MVVEFWVLVLIYFTKVFKVDFGPLGLEMSYIFNVSNLYEFYVGEEFSTKIEEGPKWEELVSKKKRKKIYDVIDIKVMSTINGN